MFNTMLVTTFSSHQFITSHLNGVPSKGVANSASPLFVT